MQLGYVITGEIEVKSMSVHLGDLDCCALCNLFSYDSMCDKVASACNVPLTSSPSPGVIKVSASIYLEWMEHSQAQAAVQCDNIIYKISAWTTHAGTN
jgi:hypothetical protein